MFGYELFQIALLVTPWRCSNTSDAIFHLFCRKLPNSNTRTRLLWRIISLGRVFYFLTILFVTIFELAGRSTTEISNITYILYESHSLNSIIPSIKISEEGQKHVLACWQQCPSYRYIISILYSIYIIHYVSILYTS